MEREVQAEMMRVDDEDEIEYRDYQCKLAYHIDELEAAQRGNNPAKMILVFNDFKAFAAKYWRHVVYDLDSKTVRRME